MKVLSITEPYATLIKEKKKFIETRNWKTNYRGELYIHASLTKITKETQTNKELMALINNTTLDFGHIICKCTLKECIYMTKAYVENIKENHHQEYICGGYKEGRYAWVLENIAPISPIKAKGSLGLWNYYTEEEIMEIMAQIQYGWIDKKKKPHKNDFNNIDNLYLLATPKETLKNKLGLCWDQVELERYLFQGYLNVKTYAIIYSANNTITTHTFLTFQKENKYYWFEHAWDKYKGIHEYASLESLLLDVKEKFTFNKEYNKENLSLYGYKKPKAHLNEQELWEHYKQGTKITL